MYKTKTFLSKDKLIVNGKTYTSQSADVSEFNKLLDLSATCQQKNELCIIFQGSHSVFSNLHRAPFKMDNITYNSNEQYIQAGKASLFNDDRSHSRIMREKNPYRIKKLGSRIKGFNQETWKGACGGVAYKGLGAKFTQNEHLLGILRDTEGLKIAESTIDNFWGTGLHLYDKNSLDPTSWKQEGLMCSLYDRLRAELK